MTPAGASAFRAAGYAGEVAPGGRALLEGGRLADLGALARGGAVLRESLYRITARIVLPGPGALLLKAHRRRGGLGGWLARWRPSRARREWEAARALEGARLPVPEPLAYGEREAADAPWEGFYAARFVEGAQGFRAALAGADPARRAALLERSAALVGALHAAGFDHRDLHAGNVLVAPGPAGADDLWITDLHRHRRGRRVGARARAQAVARWLHSLARELAPPERAAWLAAYGGAGAPARWGARVARAEARLERRWRRSRARRCLGESSRYTRAVGPWRGARARALSPARLAALVQAHDEALARHDARVRKRGRKSLVTAHGDAVVKETIAPDRRSALRTRLWPGRHAAGYRHAHLLGVLEVPTARPLAFLVGGGRVLTLYEDLSALERLDARVRTAFAQDPRGAGRRLARALAAWLADLHARGVYHGDLKAVNVRVAQGPGGPRFCLIDTDRCRFFDGPVAVRRRLKNLAQLAASLPVVASRTERLRFYRAYARAAPPGPDERRVARRVAALLARKVVVVDDPIE